VHERAIGNREGRWLPGSVPRPRARARVTLSGPRSPAWPPFCW